MEFGIFIFINRSNMLKGYICVKFLKNEKTNSFIFNFFYGNFM